MIRGRAKRMHVSRADIDRKIREKASAGDAHIRLDELVEMAEESEKMKLIYDKEDIELCMNLLDSLTVSGVSNAEKISVIW